MTPLFQPQLVNGPFGDPVVYIDCLFERRALLFDVGDVSTLPPRRILRITHLFVSHTHMDHFVGFDHLLRVTLGRGRDWQMYGPPGFIAKVEHKLAAYTWNLVDNYDTDFIIFVSEYHPADKTLASARFRLKTRFAREQLDERACDGTLLDEPAFRVRAVALDHGIPSLAFALEEKTHLNIWKTRLAELGIPTGPWLTTLKHAIREDAPDDRPIPIHWHDRDGAHERVLPLGQLRRDVVHEVPGQKIAFVVDVGFTEENARRIRGLAAGADVFFCESTFLSRDRSHANAKHHLTARQAGLLARQAGVKKLAPMHFSARYLTEPGALADEAQSEFAGMERPLRTYPL